MRTARLLNVSQHTLAGGVPARGCTCPGECTCLGVPGGVPAQGVYLPRGTCPGGVPAQGVYLPRGCTCLGGTCPGTRHPPPVNRMTDRCKNITLPQTWFAGGKYSKYEVWNSTVTIHRYHWKWFNFIVFGAVVTCGNLPLRYFFLKISWSFLVHVHLRDRSQKNGREQDSLKTLETSNQTTVGCNIKVIIILPHNHKFMKQTKSLLKRNLIVEFL